ncbi:glycosyltransferase [Microbacterium hominis]|uniref:Glycosyltransferase n=1 Tax=Microbacterium hominis TaxID=162426 RepID=A0A0B4CSH6_9MICO|nr:glycosyltransferase [Microbacterium hominis]KIC59372.1 hypothetical protein RM52_04015 [Microbacterium hominis]
MSGAKHLDPPREVVIVCPRAGGHRLSYVRLLVLRADEVGLRSVVVAPRGTAGTAEYAGHLLDRAVPHELVEIDEFNRFTLQNLLESHRGARIVFPDGDDAVLLLAARRVIVPRSSTVSVLVMRPHGQRGRLIRRATSGWIKRLARMAARSLPGVRVYSLASGASDVIRRNEVRDPIEFAPDLEAARSLRLGWAGDGSADRTWFGIVGAISARKNIDLVAAAISNLPNVGLVVAGKSDVNETDVLRWTAIMRLRGHPVVRIDRQLTDEELDTIIASLDVVTLAYSNDGPSGILGKARAAGTKVLAAGAATLRRDLRRDPSLGVWVRLSPGDLSEGARRVIELTVPPARASTSPAEFSDRLLQTDR